MCSRGLLTWTGDRWEMSGKDLYVVRGATCYRNGPATHWVAPLAGPGSRKGGREGGGLGGSAGGTTRAAM